MLYTTDLLTLFSWALLAFIAFFGWGHIIISIYKRSGGTMTFGLGSTPAIGMAGLLGIGGILMPLSAANNISVVLLTIAGCIAAFWYFFNFRRHKYFFLITFLLFIGFIFQYVISISLGLPNTNDDFIGYFPLISKLLDTGNIIDPFHTRRIGTYGGQIFLQGITMLLGSDSTGRVLEVAIAQTILLLLLLEYFGYTKKAVAIAILVYLYPFPLVNSASLYTSAVLLFTLAIQLSKYNFSRLNISDALLCGLIVAAASSLRVSTLVFTVAILFGFIAASKEKFSKAFISNIACVAFVAFVFLLGYIVALYQSSGTICYPPWAGTLNTTFSNIGDSRGWIFDTQHTFSFFLQPDMLLIMSLIVLGLYGNSRANIGIVLGLLSGALVLAFGFKSTIFPEVFRYIVPGLLVALFLTLTLAKIKPYIYIILVCGIIITTQTPTKQKFGTDSSIALLLMRELAYGAKISWVDTDTRKAYKLLQDKVPTNSGIFTMLNHTYLLDFRRNKIGLADIPGGSSPDPALYANAESLKKGLKALGYNYLIVETFGTGLEQYSPWLNHRSHWSKHSRPEGYFKTIWGEKVLQIMENIDTLARENDTITDNAGLRLIKL